jgi:enoyl-CoA hydratase
MDEFAPRPGATQDVRYAVCGSLGRILLDRPRALNALSAAMVSSVQAQLDQWASDERVQAVSLEGAGDRGLCAGGDIREIREAVLHRPQAAVAFWAAEYRLNATIDAYPKPFVALMDGVVMGGGVGLSSHGSLRVVTERSRVAMPETRIGFFPDVGALFLLSRAPGETGTHLALTGATVDGADAIAVGLADTLVPGDELPRLVEHLSSGSPLDATVGRQAPESALLAARPWVDECYAGDDPVAILQRLQRHPDAAAREAAAVLQTRSPLAVAVTLAAIRRAAALPRLEDVLAQDLRIGEHLVSQPDFPEGVRALLIDRDNDPHWRHASLADVDRDLVRSIVEP